jgi:HAD superfamily hydrolase (TIGR01490 family)
MSRTAAFFDLDRTLIATSSSLAMARPFHRAGLLSTRALARSLRDQITYLSGKADDEALRRMASRLGPVIQGWPVAEVDRVVRASMAAVIDPVIHHDVVALVAGHRAAGRDVIVISTSGQEVIEPIAMALGADEAVGSRLEVADGRWTGTVERYVYGPEKAAIVRELAASRGYDLGSCYAYSDSATDVPMLEAVGHPVAVNPDRGLRRIAAERGWEVFAPAPLADRRGRLARLAPALPVPPKRFVLLLLIPVLLAARRRR